MLEFLSRLFAARPIEQVLRDLVDIVIVAWVIYRALLVLRGTRAIQMAVGLGIVSLVYLGAKLLKLATLLSLLSSLLSSIVLIVVVVFQNDIRRALIRMGNTAWFSGGREQQSRVIDEVVAAATELARHRMGALIAFEQDANVLEFAKSEGIQLDSVVTRELLVSLFVPESVNKLHDGAVLIRDLKNRAGGCVLSDARHQDPRRAARFASPGRAGHHGGDGCGRRRGERGARNHQLLLQRQHRVEPGRPVAAPRAARALRSLGAQKARKEGPQRGAGPPHPAAGIHGLVGSPVGDHPDQRPSAGFAPVASNHGQGRHARAR